MAYSGDVDAILKTYYDEVANGGLVEKSPSRLTRGEGVQQNFFIMKIDLVGSTLMLGGRHKQTYLKLIHSYLSTIDRIAQRFGADRDQMEYAGDGLLAYFPERESSAEHVLAAACYSVYAVQQLQELDRTLSGMKPRCKIVLHYAPLTVARIGPRNNSILTAIGQPIHYVAKLEKDIGAGVGRVTKAFYAQVPPAWRKFLSGNVFEKKVVKAVPPSRQAPGYSIFAQSPAVGGLLGLSQPHSARSAFDSQQPNTLLAALLKGTYAPEPVYEEMVEREVVDYDIQWQPLFNHLEANLPR